MITYITSFIFYTLAMIGILFIGFVVYKKTNTTNQSISKGTIKIIDSIAIGPKKFLFVVKVNKEKFLIASGAEHTTFLAKLDDECQNNIGKNENELLSNNFGIVSQTSKRNNLMTKDFSGFSNVNFQAKNNLQENRLKKIQAQFNDLYEKEENELDTQDMQNFNSNDTSQKNFQAINEEKIMNYINRKYNNKNAINQLLNELGANGTIK